MRSFESIAKELKMSRKGVQYTYNKAIRKLLKYAQEHPELREYLSNSVINNSEKELLKVLYDEYGRDKF